MKKLIIFITLLFFVFVTPVVAVSPIDDYQVETILQQADVQTIVYAQEEPAPTLPELPGPDASRTDWVWWGLAAALFVLEIILRLVPTARSYSIVAILYKLLSALGAKDRALNGGTYKVKRE